MGVWFIFPDAECNKEYEKRNISYEQGWLHKTAPKRDGIRNQLMWNEKEWWYLTNIEGLKEDENVLFHMIYVIFSCLISEIVKHLRRNT